MENEIINLIGSVPSYFITCLCLKKLGFGAFSSLEMAPMVPKIGSIKIRRKQKKNIHLARILALNPWRILDPRINFDQLWLNLLSDQASYSTRIEQKKTAQKDERHFRAFCFICRSLIIQNLPSSGSPRWIITTPWPWGSPTTTWPRAARAESANIHIYVSQYFLFWSLMSISLHIEIYR